MRLRVRPLVVRKASKGTAGEVGHPGVPAAGPVASRKGPDMKRVLPEVRALRPVAPERRIVKWPCPGGCRAIFAVYEGEEPRRWHRRPDGVLLCGSCWRRWKRAEERRTKGGT